MLLLLINHEDDRILESSFRIGVHYTWFIIFLLLSGSHFAVFREAHPAWSGSTGLLTALATTSLFFISITLHELGHSFVAIARGVQVRSITLFIFEGVAQTEKEAEAATNEFYIAIAGPLVSFTLSGVMQKEAPTIAADMSILYSIEEQMLLSGQRSCLVTEGGRIVGLVT